MNRARKFLNEYVGVENESKKEKREIEDLLIVLNSQSPLIFKYPIGNKELTARVKELEGQRKLFFDDKFSKWKKGK